MRTKYKVGDIYQCSDKSYVEFVSRLDSDNANFKCLLTNKVFRANISNIAKGKGKNLYFPSVCNFGFIGQGKYTSKDYTYSLWNNMIKRVHENNFETYKDVQIDKSWEDFQVFSADYHDMLKGVKFDNPQIDKDLKSSKPRGSIYSKETCLLLPHQINTALQLENQADKETDAPCGVSLHKLTGKFKAQISKYGKTCYLGLYATKEEANFIYKKEKARYITDLANKFKKQMPVETYSLLIDKSERIMHYE